MSHNGQHWHANSKCFACFTCRGSLLGKAFLPERGKIYCSIPCSKGECAPSRSVSVPNSPRKPPHDRAFNINPEKGSPRLPAKLPVPPSRAPLSGSGDVYNFRDTYSNDKSSSPWAVGQSSGLMQMPSSATISETSSKSGNMYDHSDYVKMESRVPNIPPDPHPQGYYPHTNEIEYPPPYGSPRFDRIPQLTVLDYPTNSSVHHQSSSNLDTTETHSEQLSDVSSPVDNTQPAPIQPAVRPKSPLHAPRSPKMGRCALQHSPKFIQRQPPNYLDDIHTPEERLNTDLNLKPTNHRYNSLDRRHSDQKTNFDQRQFIEPKKTNDYKQSTSPKVRNKLRSDSSHDTSGSTNGSLEVLNNIRGGGTLSVNGDQLVLEKEIDEGSLEKKLEKMMAEKGMELLKQALLNHAKSEQLSSSEIGDTEMANFLKALSSTSLKSDNSDSRSSRRASSTDSSPIMSNQKPKKSSLQGSKKNGDSGVSKSLSVRFENRHAAEDSNLLNHPEEEIRDQYKHKHRHRRRHRSHSHRSSLPRSSSYSGQDDVYSGKHRTRHRSGEARSEHKQYGYQTFEDGCSTCSSSSSEEEDIYSVRPTRMYGGARISYLPNDALAAQHSTQLSAKRNQEKDKNCIIS